MTDEELEKAVKEYSEEIEKLSAADKPLSRAESRHKRLCEMKKQVLEQVKQARAKQNVTQEARHMVTYALLNSYGDKPLLFYFLYAKFRWNVIY